MKRNWIKLITIATLALIIALGTGMFALAEEKSEETYTVSETVTINVSEKDFMSNEDMAEGFLNRAFYGERTNLRKGSTAGSQLTGAELNCYNKLKPLISEIANGEVSSTEISVSGIFDKISYTYAELGFSETTVNWDTVKAAFARQFSLSNQYLSALLYDCPYDLYWFDKTETGGLSTGYKIAFSIDEGNVNESTVSIYNGVFYFDFSVAQEFQDTSHSNSIN